MKGGDFKKMLPERMKFLSEFDNFYNNLAPDIKERGGLDYKDKMINKVMGNMKNKYPFFTQKQY